MNIKANLENNSGWYTMAQQLIEFRADLHHPCRGLFLHDQVGDFMAVGFPVWFGDRKGAGEVGSDERRLVGSKAAR
jgi:hypothetical protein